METKFLFPHKLKYFGWTLFIGGLLLLLVAIIIEDEPDFLTFKSFALSSETFTLSNSETNTYFTFVENNFFDELIGLLLIVGGLLIAFSKQKIEDEFIVKLRLDSLLWATYINYIILIFSILFIYDMSFFYVLVANMFTILILFIIRFNWLLYKSAKFGFHEK